MMSIETRKAQLEARLADLTGRLTKIEAELESHQSTEREADEVLEGMGLSGQQEIRMIEAALARVAEGNYGICVNCGNDIGDARLDVLPFTPFCRDCAA